MLRPSTLTAALITTAALAATAAPAGAADSSDTPMGTGHVLRHGDRTATPTAGLAAAAAAAAPGGSIVFIRNHNVWLTRPDGSGARAVTSDGTESSSYEHPSMADNGVIAVMKGDAILRMGQDGVLLNKMVPPSLFTPDYGTIHITPILDPEISPDGAKIAYSQLRLEHYGGGDYNYNVTESMTSFTDAAQWSGPDKYGIMTDAYSPSWVTNSKVVVDASGDVRLADLGHAPAPWFTSDDVFAITDPYAPFVALNEPEVSPNRQAVVFGNPGGVGLWATNGDPAGASPGKPLGGDAGMLCALTTSNAGDPIAQDPTFGPDSDSIAYVEGSDLAVVTHFSACSAATGITTIVSGGASEPSWSPAPLTAAPAGGPTQPGAPGGAGSGQTTTHAFALAKAPAVGGKARVGKRLRAVAGTWSPAPTSVSYTWLRNGRPIKGGTQASYAVKKADRSKRIQVRVTVRRSGYAARTATSKPVRVKR